MKINIAKDTIAKIVMERANRADDDLGRRTIHQGKTFRTVANQAEKQYRREYDSDLSSRLQKAFGFCPTRYYGIVQQKVNAARAWKRDLVVNHLDAVLSAVPTPEPELDKQSRDNIRKQIQRELQERLLTRGGGLVDVMTDADGAPAPEVLDFMRREASKLKEVEQARMVAVATGAAKRADRKLRDSIIQGGFRNMYGVLTHYQFLYGIGFGRFPHWENRLSINHKGKSVVREYEMRPTFRAINPLQMLCINDAASMQDNTANIEIASATKAQLVRMASDDRYDRKAIEEIITDFEKVDRNWIGTDFDFTKEAVYWGPDEPIPLLIHEGFLNGADLLKHGVTGVDALDSVNVHAVICGGRTILCEALKSPAGADRTFFGVPFNKFGDGLYDVVGMGAALYDLEEQVNTIFHTFEHNMDWASRPPTMINSTVFENPLSSKSIVPGAQYEVADAYTGGQMPDPIRPMRAVSAQYHLIMTQLDNLLRKADEACGLPAFAYSSQDFGRSSLGEYSQRISNALRVIKEAAIEEDIALEPAWRALFNHHMENDKGFSEGQDIDLSFRGITGLLTQDLARQERRAMLSVVQNGVDRQSLPKMVEDFAYRQVLEDAGYPVDSLGMGDALLDQAVASANAAAGANLPFGAGGQQVPQLDGRSGGVARGAVAGANGASTY